MWYIILAIITGIYLLFNILMPTGDMFQAYILRPIIWISLAITTFLISRNEGVNILKFKKVRKWNLGKTPLQAGLMLGGFHVSLLIIIGILFGFGKSPYSFTPTAIATNLFYVASILFGIELSRAYLVKKGTSKTRKYTTLILVLITLLFMFIRITPNELSVLNFSQPELALEFIGATMITMLGISLLATYLSYLGGASASLGYMGVLLCFEWFSPILPNPHWTMLAFVGTIAPAIGYALLQDSIQPFVKNRKNQHNRKRKSSNGQGWTIVAVFTLIIVFFSYGYLGVEPTVIYSGSMQPNYQVGDIALINEVEIDEIQVGDVIQFYRDNTTYMHRVVEIYENENGEKMFIVQGDANDDPDSEHVNVNYVIGKSVFNIPKIGWVQIYANQLLRKVPRPV